MTLRRIRVKVRWNRHHASEREAFWFSKERDQNDRGENGALCGDGKNQGAAANAAFAFALLGAAFDETALQPAEVVLRSGIGTGAGAGFDGHHTPPQKNAASECRDFCDAGFPWVAQKPQETGAALAGM